VMLRKPFPPPIRLGPLQPSGPTMGAIPRAAADRMRTQVNATSYLLPLSHAGALRRLNFIYNLLTIPSDPGRGRLRWLREGDHAENISAHKPGAF
jgi:hypothetical protein